MKLMMDIAVVALWTLVAIFAYKFVHAMLTTAATTTVNT